MHYGSRALGLGSILLLAAQAVAAQQQPKDLPEAPAAKQEADHKHDSSLQATFEVLGRRSVFFPDLAASPGPLSSKQKLELFAGKSLAPSRFLSSALSSGVSQARNSLPDYGQGMAGYGKGIDRKSTRLNSSHPSISYAVFCLKKKKKKIIKQLQLHI